MCKNYLTISISYRRAGIADDKPIDVLGSLYMELELGNSNNGQFFTPPEISSLMAKITYGDAISKINQPFITLSEPTCGAGGMVLAFVNEMINQGFNPAEKLFVQCIDIDRLAGFMCYVQLTLWNVPAEIIIGDSLSGKYREIYYTPAYYIGNWHNKLRLRQFSEAFKTLCQGDDKEQGDLEENKQQETENQQPMADAIVKNESTVETVINPKLKLNSDPQIDLFDFDIEH